MKLKAVCSISVSAASDCPMVAMLRPRGGLAQSVISERYDLHPWAPVDEYADSYGNLCQRLVVPQGQMHIRVEVLMEVEDHIAVAPEATMTPITEELVSSTG